MVLLPQVLLQVNRTITARWEVQDTDLRPAAADGCQVVGKVNTSLRDGTAGLEVVGRSGHDHERRSAIHKRWMATVVRELDLKLRGARSRGAADAKRDLGAWHRDMAIYKVAQMGGSNNQNKLEKTQHSNGS